MGWLFNNRIPENIKAEIERLCTFDDNTRSTRPLRVSRDGSIWTAAVEMTLRSGTEIPEDYRPDDNGRVVFGAVFRTRRDHGGWGHRLDEETVDPEFARARRHFKVILEKPPGYTRSRTVFQCVETGVTCRILGFRGRGWVEIDNVQNRLIQHHK